MSYSLPMRVLESLNRKPSINLFRDNISNTLVSTVSLDRKRRLMHSAEGALPSLQSLEGPWRELACLDLSPTGLFFAQNRSRESIARVWSAYSTYVEVIDPSECKEQGIYPTKEVSRVHFRLLEAYGAFFDHCLHQLSYHTS